MNDLFCSSCMSDEGPFTFIWESLICKACLQPLSDMGKELREKEE